MGDAMSRVSVNEDREGKVYNGFDYAKQCWVLEGVVQDCGHAYGTVCDCYGRKHAGETI